MSQKIIYTCDVCGMNGHEAKEPSKECIEALREEIKFVERLYVYARRREEDGAGMRP